MLAKPEIHKKIENNNFVELNNFKNYDLYNFKIL